MKVFQSDTNQSLIAHCLKLKHKDWSWYMWASKINLNHSLYLSIMHLYAIHYVRISCQWWMFIDLRKWRCRMEMNAAENERGQKTHSPLNLRGKRWKSYNETRSIKRWANRCKLIKKGEYLSSSRWLFLNRTSPHRLLYLTFSVCLTDIIQIWRVLKKTFKQWAVWRKKTEFDLGVKNLCYFQASTR